MVLAAGAGLGLLGNILTSHYMSPDSYGRLTALLSSVSILAVLASLGFPWYFLANQNLYLRKRSKYILIVLAASLVVAIFSFFAFEMGGGGAGGWLLIATSLSLIGVLDAQVQRQQIWAAVMQSLPAICKGVAAVLLAVMVMLKLDDGLGGEFYYSALLYVSGGAVAFSFVFFLRNFSRRIEGGECAATGVDLGGLAAYLGSALLSLSYNMALPPIVAYFFGAKLAATLGIYQIFWSINSLFLTAFVNNKIAPALLSEECAETVGVIWKSALKYSLNIGVLSVFVAVLGAYVGEATIWRAYSGLWNAMIVGAVALFVRSFSAAYGVRISAASFIRKKMLAQVVVFMLMVIVVAALSGSELGSVGLLLIVLFLEIVLFLGYWIIGRSSFRN